MRWNRPTQHTSVHIRTVIEASNTKGREDENYKAKTVELLQWGFLTDYNRFSSIFLTERDTPNVFGCGTMLQAAKTPCFVPNEVIGFIDLFLPPAL
jgi:hypothetical protein